MTPSNLLLPITRYSLVICRNRFNKYLCIKECNKKWWIPGGGVEPKETHAEGALREVREETGIEVSLKGIITFDQMNFGIQNSINAFRVIYYAEPIDQNSIPKQQPDQESLGAAFLSLKEILELKPHWRVPEIYNYPYYLQSGGQIFPLSIFKQSTM